MPFPCLYCGCLTGLLQAEFELHQLILGKQCLPKSLQIIIQLRQLDNILRNGGLETGSGAENNQRPYSPVRPQNMGNGQAVFVVLMQRILEPALAAIKMLHPVL